MMMELGKGGGLSNTELYQINTQITIGIGTNDTMVSLEESEASAHMLPNASLIKLEGFQHVLDKNDPNEIASFIITSILGIKKTIQSEL
jgi:hypothetical protein